ncbi:hypothetical protein [Moorena sp. SIO3H5]|uniref:hypothetical protein n=1 Tax=Moorena sp. SIO3H5 TaxID=2607834 RepID=UPI0013B7CDAB|nr:hypothetical protein [Moorena sp. SIO3H5]NEO69308.1 hypothetical protein [Moorena sp. SIO3H5]
MGRWGDGEMGRWRDGEMGRWGRFLLSDAGRSWGFPRGLQGADAGSAHSPSP